MRKEITEYIEREIQSYYRDKLDSLNKLNINKLLTKKNPYLFRIKNLETSESVVTELVNAHLSSSEETIFGNWMEKLAIQVCKLYYKNAQKSTAVGIDLEFTKNNIRYLISIKSGPNWGNSNQIKKLEDQIKSTRKTLRTSGNNEHVEFVNGCIYGKANRQYADYEKLCGQKFWQLLTDDVNFYKEIIIPLGIVSKKKDDEYNKSLSAKRNQLTFEFTRKYCDSNGNINWNLIVEHNSKAAN